MNEKKNNNYAQLIGIVTQMVVMMGAGFYGGHLLDDYLDSPKPTYTLIIGLTVMLASLYLTIKQVNKFFDSKK